MVEEESPKISTTPYYLQQKSSSSMFLDVHTPFMGHWSSLCAPGQSDVPGLDSPGGLRFAGMVLAATLLESSPLRLRCQYDTYLMG